MNEAPLDYAGFMLVLVTKLQYKAQLPYPKAHNFIVNIGIQICDVHYRS